MPGNRILELISACRSERKALAYNVSHSKVFLALCLPGDSHTHNTFMAVCWGTGLQGSM